MPVDPPDSSPGGAASPGRQWLVPSPDQLASSATPSPPVERPVRAGSEDLPQKPSGSGRRFRVRRPTTPMQWAMAGLSVGVVGAILAAVITGGFLFAEFLGIDRTDVKLATARASEPQNFLIVGSDTRDLKNTSSADAGGIFGKGKDAEPAGQRSDTILVLRVDPKKRTLEMLSLPRDLWVTVAETNEEGKLNKAYNGGPQRLIDTIQAELDLEINHFVEVNFEGFKSLVEAIDGVPMYFDRPLRDANTGLRITAPGCVNMDGVQALAFARSRHLRYYSDGRWHSDGTADLGRMTRQQTFIRRALAKVAGLGLTDVNKLRELVSAGADSVRLDSDLSISDIVGLGRRFATFDAKKMVTHRLPTTSFRTAGGRLAERMNPEAQAVLDIFRGKAPATVAVPTSAPRSLVEAEVTVDVYNATGRSGLAGRVQQGLAEYGFNLGPTGNQASAATTTVGYGKGGEAAAKLVASHLSPAVQLVSNPKVSGLHVVVTVGADFQKVVKSAPTTTAAPTTTTPPTTVKGSGSAKKGVTTTTTTAPAPGADTKPIGYTTGDPPAGVTCG